MAEPEKEFRKHPQPSNLGPDAVPEFEKGAAVPTIAGPSKQFLQAEHERELGILPSTGSARSDSYLRFEKRT